MTTTLENAWLSVREAAPCFDISTSTLHDLIRAGLAPVEPVKVGRVWKFRRAEIQRFVEGQA